jgi:acyl-CoA thioesterase
MDAREWLGLEATHNPNRWCLPVVPGISTGGGFLFGGCGLGASIAALEGTTGRAVIWATAQYLSYARPPSVLDIDVLVAAAGRHTTQARAVGHVVDTEILTVNAALGTREFAASGQWAELPSVPPPAECPPREPIHPGIDSFATRIDQRWALRDPRRGHCAVWTHLPDLLEVSAPALAVLGDYVPLGLGQTLELPITSNSLDNTIRVAQLVPTEWVLVDVHIDVVSRGFGHGFVYLWAEDGTLLATASQSAIIRPRPAPPVPG